VSDEYKKQYLRDIEHRIEGMSADQLKWEVRNTHSVLFDEHRTHMDYFAAHCPLPWQDERTVGNNTDPYRRDARRRFDWAEAMLAEKSARASAPADTPPTEAVLEEM
jgi:hypothetical protein